MRGDGIALWKVIVWLASAVIVALLALENQHSVSLQLFFWHLPHISLALVVLLSLLLGAFVGVGGLYWNRLQTRRTRPDGTPTPVKSLAPVEEISPAADVQSIAAPAAEEHEHSPSVQ